MLTVLRRSAGTSRVEVIDGAAIGRLEAGPEDGGLVWIDADRPDDVEARAIARLCGLDVLAVSEALQSRRPALRVDDDTLLGVVMTAVASEGHPRIVRTVVIVGPTAIVTCHPDRHRVGSERVKAAATRSFALPGATPSVALTVLLDDLIGTQWALGDEIDDRLVEVEHVAVDDPEVAAVDIALLRRDLLTVHRVIGPLRRQLADVVDVAASHRANAVMQATSSWGAILVVATLITGVYGMNFRAMPELTWRWGYPFALGLMVATTVVLYRLFRTRGWL